MKWIDVPENPGLYFYKSPNYQAIFRELNGHDIFWLSERNFDLQNATSVYDLVLRLQVSTADDLLELDFLEFNTALKDICVKLVDKNILTIDTWFELIFLVGGKRFEPDYKPWLTTSIPTLLGMGKIAQKYLTTL
jgi:hypothetical protein